MYLQKIKYGSAKLLVFILAFQILNLSVQSGVKLSSDPKSVSIGSVNQIDCFIEYFCEDICSLKSYDDMNDFALHNKYPNGHKLALKFVDIQMPVHPSFLQVNKVVFKSSSQNHFPLWDNKYDYLFSQEITPPPPKRNFFLI